MNKKIAIVLVATLFLLIVALLAFGNVDKIDEEKDEENVVEPLKEEEQNQEVINNNSEEHNEVQTDTAGT